MNRFCMAVVSLAFVAGCVGQQPADEIGTKSEAVIYGEDDRKEVFEFLEASWRERVKASTVALIEPRFLSRPPSGRVTVNVRSLGSAYMLCDGEPFFDQPAGADCSATLIDDDLVLTAGHCFEKDYGCDFYSYVFDYFYASDGQLEPLTSADVFGCRDFVVRNVSPESAVNQIDYAIVQLDRPALAPREPAPLSMKALKKTDPIFVLGFPSGVPAKIDDGAQVIEPRSATLDYFKLNSDTFAGSSGSGLFNARGEVVGVLVRGAKDYVQQPGETCSVAKEIDADADGSPWEQGTYVKRAIDALCKASWPSERLCGIKPSCGDGFCTMNEIAGSCPRDCADASCTRPPCTKRVELDLVAGDVVTADDAGIDEDGAPKSKSNGCSAASGSMTGLHTVGFLALLGLTVRMRRRRSQSRS